MFDDLQRRAAEIETVVEHSAAAAHVESRRLIFGILVAWSCVVIASTTGLLRRERRRRRAEEALRKTKETLEETVADRTRALQTLNDDLASELAERRKSEKTLREQETQLRLLSEKLLGAQETERSRVSRELHDELGHALVLMKLELGRLERSMAPDSPRTTASCRSALSGAIDEAIEAVRRLARDLRPPVLEELGLTAALKSLLEQCGRIDDEDAVCASFADVDDLLPQDAQVVVYRIAQEAITNARKHARAQRVSLCVDKTGECLSLLVEDDGEGFEAADAAMRQASEGGLGLATMQERARILGGSLDVASTPGRGTRVRLTVPLPGKAGH
jgi:signal transduction histidine kinase